MPRFFVSSPLPSPGEIVTLVGDDARHIALSLRMKSGDPITLCDGKGEDARGVIESVGQSVPVRVTDVFPSSAEPSFSATVFQAAVKGEKFDTVVRKSTELGAARIVPFVSSRCIYRPAAGERDKKADRWDKIAKEAAMQSGRGVIPEVGTTLGFPQMLSEAAEREIALFCWEGATESVKRAIGGKRPASAAVVIGPEGGFSEEEAAAARAAGLVPVSLGERILRTETASGAVLSMLAYEFDF